MNLKDLSAREQLKSTFSDVSVQRNINLDRVVLDCYAEQLSKVEWFIETQARQHNPVHLQILKMVHGIGRILSLTISYEIGNITHFESVQNFSSYARLVKCKAESAGKSYGTQGNKRTQNYLLKLQKRMSKAKALSTLAHNTGGVFIS